MIELDNIRKLSYKKVQLDYEVPVFMIQTDTNRKVLVETLKVSIRYQKDPGKTNAANSILKGVRKTRYNLMYSSISDIVQNLGFRNKVGKVSPCGRKFGQIDPFYTNGITVDNYHFEKVLKEIHIFDHKYLSNFRDIKLTELL